MILTVGRARLRLAWTWQQLAATTAVGGGALLAWALFWPESACMEPVCARERFALSIEVDAFRQVAPIAFDLPVEPRPISLQSILRAGGIDVALRLDQLNLPYNPAGGALDRADLYQFAAAWRDLTPAAAADAKLYALLSTELVSDNGEPLFGIMFDDAGREGFAVAPQTTARYFSAREPKAVAMLQLRTFVHELLHALNRHHLDAAQLSDGRLTLEAPTRCISGQQQRHWFLSEPPLMSISPTTIHFFQTAAAKDVLPGKGNSPFDLGRSSPTECSDARAHTFETPADTRWQLALKRLRQLFSLPAAYAAQQATEPEAVAEPPVDLRIQALPSAYPLGYPIAVRILAANTSARSLPLKGRLNPSYGIVSIEYRRADSPKWRTLQPSARFEPVNDQQSMLPPGENTEETVPIYFSNDGWTFPQPAEYEVRGRLSAGADAPDIVSAPASVRVAAAMTDEDRAALRPLLDGSGRLDNDVGRLLTFGGRIGPSKDSDAIAAAAQSYGHTALGAALRLTLISRRLRPPIDPATGERPAPALEDALELLQDTCTDSGVTALRQDLQQRFATKLPDSIDSSAVTHAAAWDGTLASGEVVATYSDRSLRPWGPSIHFCFNETSLRTQARTITRQLGRELRRGAPARVVIVGHSDHEGACRYNDTLALRRAQSVRRALIRAGVPGTKVIAVTLGEKRPLDFAASDSARLLNRRVEILVDDAELTQSQTGQQITPSCLPPSPVTQASR